MSEKKVVMSEECCKWPEWKAFRDRLGIPAISTTGITITLSMREPVKITHEYLGTEDVKEGEE